MTSSATSNPTQKRMHRTPEHQQSASHCTLSLSVAYPHPHGTLDARPQHYLSSLTVLLRQKQAKELHLSLSLSLSLLYTFSGSINLQNLVPVSQCQILLSRMYLGTSPIEKEKKQVFGTCSGVRSADLKSQAHIQNISLSFSMFCTATYVTLVSTPSRLARKMTKMGRWCGEKQKNVDV